MFSLSRDQLPHLLIKATREQGKKEDRSINAWLVGWLVVGNTAHMALIAASLWKSCITFFGNAIAGRCGFPSCVRLVRDGFNFKHHATERRAVYMVDVVANVLSFSLQFTCQLFFAERLILFTNALSAGLFAKLGSALLLLLCLGSYAGCLTACVYMRCICAPSSLSLAQNRLTRSRWRVVESPLTIRRA